MTCKNKMEPSYRIFLKSDKETTDAVLKDASSYEKYIIFSNETILNENQKMTKLVKDLENQITLLETETDKQSETIRYMRGFLKNIVIMQKLSSSLADEQAKIVKKYKDYINAWFILAIRHFRYLQFMMCMTVLILYELDIYSVFQSTIIGICFIIFSAFHESTVRNMDHPNINDILISIEVTEKELNELKKGQDFLNDYIDIM